MAIEQVKDWYTAFPNSTITLGNHDLIIARKSEEAGIDKRFVRKLNEVLGCPDWKFEEQFVHDNVLYTHGTGCSGKGIMKRVQNWGTSIKVWNELYVEPNYTRKDGEGSFNVGLSYKL